MNYVTRNIIRTVAVASALGVATLVLPATTWATDSGVPTLSTGAISVKAKADADPNGPDARKRLPWSFTLGAFLPSASGASLNTGFESAWGYRFPMDSIDVRVSLRGQFATYGDGSGNTAAFGVDALTVDALYRIQGFYVGPGIGFAEAAAASTATQSSQTGSGTLFLVTAGYDFSPRWFVEARYQTGSLLGVTVTSTSFDIGYRF